jgi:hypothetical protein
MSQTKSAQAAAASRIATSNSMASIERSAHIDSDFTSCDIDDSLFSLAHLFEEPYSRTPSPVSLHPFAVVRLVEPDWFSLYGARCLPIGLLFIDHFVLYFGNTHETDDPWGPCYI